ncbi:MAG: DCC1-like thiol-disulfide oxidoreductase family protein [Chryseolinea sp.]
MIVLFDGICNLCNASVQFIVKRDSAGKMKFASLQSSFGKSQLSKYNFDPDALHSIVVIDDGIAYQKSDAAMKIASNLRRPWSLLAALKVIPRFIRDGVYNLVSRSRYSLYGKRDSCMIPDEGLRARFIEDGF